MIHSRISQQEVNYIQKGLNMAVKYSCLTKLTIWNDYVKMWKTIKLNNSFDRIVNN